MRPQVNTEKHIVQQSLFAVASGAITNLNIGRAIAVPTAAATDLREGCRISAVYIEMWLSSDDVASGTAIVTLEKTPGTQTVFMTAAQSAALNAYPNKKNILHTFMGLLPNNVDYPMAVIKGWFKIPKGKQRFGIDDRLILNIHGQSNGVAGCGFFLYKEQF